MGSDSCQMHLVPLWIYILKIKYRRVHFFFIFFLTKCFVFLQPFPHCMYKMINLFIIIDSLCSHPKGKLFLSQFEGSGLYGILSVGILSLSPGYIGVCEISPHALMLFNSKTVYTGCDHCRSFELWVSKYHKENKASVYCQGCVVPHPL